MMAAVQESATKPQRGRVVMVAALAVVLVAINLSATVPGGVGDLAAGVVALALGVSSVYWLVTDPPSARDGAVSAGQFARGVAKTALVLVPLLLTVFATEGLARWIYRDVTTTADFRGYFSNKWLRSEVRHNHYDYRGAEFDEHKAAGIYRVAVIGDSFTYGNGVAEDRRFSNLLDAHLRPRGIEVLNFGFPGNNWPEHVGALERKVLRLEPDFVLLQWFTNDVERASEVAARPALPHLLVDRDLHEHLHARSALYTLLDAQWTRFQVARLMGDPYVDYMQRVYADPHGEPAVFAATLMRRFIEECRKHGVGVGLVLFPDTGVPLGAEYPFRFLHERVLEICTAERVPCVDLLDSFSQVADRSTLWASPLDAHPSALANEIAAKEILAAFAPTWGTGR